ARILPLCFGRQAVFPARRQPPGFLLLLGEQTAKLDRARPRHALDRQLVRIDSGRQGGVAPLLRKVAGTVAHYLEVLPLRDLALSQPEPTRERDRPLVRRLAHLKIARRAPAELHPQAIARPMLPGFRAFGERL